MKKSAAVFSPAKVNLRLQIGARRADGYHDATSVMQALTLHDTVTVSFDDAAQENAEGLIIDVRTVSCEDVPELDVPADQNIAYKAAVALAEAFGVQQGHVGIVIEKHIPFQAGLGGGSSNAAAVLVGLCELWGKDPESDQVIAVAQNLGADVAFFLHGGCVQLGGVGDVLERSFTPARGTVVLVKLDEGVSTKAAYEAFDDLMAQGAVAASDGTELQSIEDAAALPLFNNLAPASEHVLPRLTEAREWLSAQPGIACDASGKPAVLLSGSGSATFAILETNDSIHNAAAIVAAAKRKGWWARSCSFSPIGAKILNGTQKQTNLGAVHKSW